MKTVTKKGLMVVVAAVFCFEAGCMFMPAKQKNTELPATNTDFQIAFDAAVKACRQLDLPVNLVNKEVGQIQCGLKTSEVNFFSVGYAVDTLIERNGDTVKNISVKVVARGGAYAGMASDSDADAFTRRYLAVLESAGVK